MWAGAVSQPADAASAQAAAPDGEAEEDDELDIQLEEPDALAQDGSEVRSTTCSAEPAWSSATAHHSFPVSAVAAWLRGPRNAHVCTVLHSPRTFF